MGRSYRSHRFVNERAALRARVPEERVWLAPKPELQAVLTEDAIQRLFDDPALLLQERLTQWRGQPLLYGLRIVCR